VTGSLATSQAHTASVRFKLGETTATDTQAGFFALLTAFGAGLFSAGWQVTGCRVQNEGSALTVPTATISSLAGFVGTASAGYSPSKEALEARFVGRSPESGRRVSLSLYTAVLTPGDNFRWLASSGSLATQVAAAIDVLTDAQLDGQFVCIDNTEAVWYPYLDVQYNSYWETELRG